MNCRADRAVRDCSNIRLRLRSDLVFTPHRSRSDNYYLVQDPLNSRYFRVGLAEYALISLLDGRTTIGQAYAQLSGSLPDHQLTEQDAAGLCRWLVQSGLASNPEASARSDTQSDRAAEKGGFNPLVFRFPLAMPDRLFSAASRRFGWLFSSTAAFAWMALVISGFYQVARQWETFSNATQGIFAVDNWLALAACWFGLKLLHELSHGIVCRRYGGDVRETGVLLILFAPLAYVDVTSSWQFRSRWQRMHVAAAGMYTELAIAAAAALVWAGGMDGWMGRLCVNTIIMAGFTTLVFNANPLMKFDGYFIFSEAIGVPNLYASGQRYMRHFARRFLLGLNSSLPAWSSRQAVIVRIYAMLSFAWRVLICVSLTIAAATLFHGAGIVLAAMGMAFWLGLPIARFLRYFIVGVPGETPWRVRFLARGCILGMVTLTLLVFIPWPGARRAPAIVDYSALTIVRASSPGFLERLHVHDGQLVAAGQLIAELQNRELRKELADLQLLVRQCEVRIRRLTIQGKIALQQAQQEQKAGLEKQLAEKRRQVEQLTIRTTRAGRVLGRELDQLKGQYLAQGDRIVTIGDETAKELRVSIAQADIFTFHQTPLPLVEIDLPRQRLTRTRLTKIIPRAGRQPPHPAMAAVNGGPLAVRASSNEASESRHELLSSRFTALVTLDTAASLGLCAGQTGFVYYRPFSESIGRHLIRSVSSWVDRQWRRATS